MGIEKGVMGNCNCQWSMWNVECGIVNGQWNALYDSPLTIDDSTLLTSQPSGLHGHKARCRNERCGAVEGNRRRGATAASVLSPSASRLNPKFLLCRGNPAHGEGRTEITAQIHTVNALDHPFFGGNFTGLETNDLAQL